MSRLAIALVLTAATVVLAGSALAGPEERRTVTFLFAALGFAGTAGAWRAWRAERRR